MMLVTSLWLLSLMANFFSLKIVIVIGVIALALLLSQLWRIKGKRATLLTVGFLIIVTAIGLIIGSLTADKWAKPLPQDHHWTPLNVEQIKQDVAQGKTVFVDVTADWCITCKANKVGVILQEPVYSALDQENIVLMRGDWTKPSDYVTNFLQSHGRFGVPFNIVYGPAAPNGIELPVILTSEQVLDALKQASSKE